MTSEPWLRMPVDTWLPIRWYSGYLEGLPDLCVGKLPGAFGRSGIGQWKVWIVETSAETVAPIAALSMPVPMHRGVVDFESGPDAAVRVDAGKHYGAPLVAVHAPPEPVWPWITLRRLPSVTVAGPRSLKLNTGFTRMSSMRTRSPRRNVSRG